MANFRIISIVNDSEHTALHQIKYLTFRANCNIVGHDKDEGKGDNIMRRYTMQAADMMMCCNGMQMCGVMDIFHVCYKA